MRNRILLGSTAKKTLFTWVQNHLEGPGADPKHVGFARSGCDPRVGRVAGLSGSSLDILGHLEAQGSSTPSTGVFMSHKPDMILGIEVPAIVG